MGHEKGAAILMLAAPHFTEESSRWQSITLPHSQSTQPKHNPQSPPLAVREQEEDSRVPMLFTTWKITQWEGPPQLVQMTFSLNGYRRDGTIRTSPDYLQAKGQRAQVVVSPVCHHQTSIKQPTSAGEKGSPVLKSSSVSDLPLEIHFMNFLQF